MAGAAASAAAPCCTDAGPSVLTVGAPFSDLLRKPSRDGPFGAVAPDYTAASSRAGRLSMKELTENTARPGPGGP